MLWLIDFNVTSLCVAASRAVLSIREPSPNSPRHTTFVRSAGLRPAPLPRRLQPQLRSAAATARITSRQKSGSYRKRSPTVAGRNSQDPPVTFGELWDNGGDQNAPRDIELVLMTTNIT